MSLLVFLLVLVSAVLHAAWNFTARKVLGNLVVIWVGLWLGWAAVTPAVIWMVLRWGFPQTITPVSVICILATGIIHTVYFLFLAAGYEHGEISLVYPIARGSGIALIAILAGVFYQETIVLSGAIGISLISIGILLFGVTAERRTDVKSIALAVSIGSTIVAYSLVDKLGVQHVNPIVYIWFLVLVTSALLTPMVLTRHRTVIKTARQYIAYSAVIGIGLVITYLIILFAFTRGRVGYIVAVREVSVVLGTVGGVVFLKERMTRFKALAIGLIAIGILFIKIS